MHEARCWVSLMQCRNPGPMGTSSGRTHSSLSPSREQHGALYLRIGRPPGAKKKELYQSLIAGPDFLLAVWEQANVWTSLYRLVRGLSYIIGKWLAYCGHSKWFLECLGVHILYIYPVRGAQAS